MPEQFRKHSFIIIYRKRLSVNATSVFPVPNVSAKPMYDARIFQAPIHLFYEILAASFNQNEQMGSSRP